MIAIALVDQKWGIAANGKQIIFIPDDLKRFKQITEGRPIIMGRKTYEALPGKRPLRGRRNLILSRNMETAPEGFELGDLMHNDPTTCVIGGESVYAQLVPLCNRVYLTVVEHDFQADQFFPNILRAEGEWELKSRSPNMEYQGYIYHYDEYVRVGTIGDVSDEKEDLQEFNKAEILVVAETLIKKVKGEYQDEEQQASAILANLAVLCYSQGMNAAITKEENRHKLAENIDDVFADVISEAQIRWEWIITYCRDVLDIELHPLAMLFVLRFITSSENDPYAPHVLAGIDRVSKQLDEKIAEDVREATAEAVPEIDEFEGDRGLLIVEYFKLLEKIGTFHRDRTKYDTEEQRELHDRIVAIYHKIGRAI